MSPGSTEGFGIPHGAVLENEASVAKLPRSLHRWRPLIRCRAGDGAAYHGRRRPHEGHSAMLPKSADRGRRGGGAPVDGVDGWAGREGAHLGEHVGEGWEGRGWAWGE